MLYNIISLNIYYIPLILCVYVYVCMCVCVCVCMCVCLCACVCVQSGDTLQYLQLLLYAENM